MINRYLETKFHSPPLRSESVARPRLVDRLQQGLCVGCKLSLISAPAGYGKTTLVTEWLHTLSDTNSDICVAWLSLDEADNDPARLLGYWLTALMRKDKTMGHSAMSLLNMPQIPPTTAILDEFINELSWSEKRFILVLDDYHVITHPQIYDALAYFIEHQPPQFHLVITTREDPPLPLARMRVRSMMTEIRAHDLRFTQAESHQFFQHMHLNLQSEHIDALEARTEGWAAGLQLAALAMQNQPNQQEFLDQFSGSHRYIIDYLLDEVLKNQSAEIREFLNKTSLLKRFNADLCQAVTHNPNSAALLAHLERTNLFLIPLDDQRGWFRYHHLFADVLRSGLPAVSENEIYALAAQWLEENGSLVESIPYWLAAAKPSHAARDMAMLAPDLLKNGELRTMLHWLNALPEQIINQYPDLLTYKALSLLMLEQFTQARDLITLTRQLINQDLYAAGHSRRLSLQAWFAVSVGDPQSREIAQAALAQTDESDAFFRILALLALGSSHSWEADISCSSQIFREAYQLSKKLNQPALSLGALANLAFALIESGELHEAETLCRTAMTEYVDAKGKPLPILGLIYLPLCTVCFEKGDFDDAQSFALRGRELCQRLFSSASLGGDSEIILAQVAFHRGDTRQSFALLDEIMQATKQRNMTLIVYKMLVVKTELFLYQNRMMEAGASLQELDALLQSGLPKAGQLVAHLRARYLAAQGHTEEALKILGGLREVNEQNGSIRRLLGIYLTQAIIEQDKGNTLQALQHFEAALQLAAPQGYRSIFFPLGTRKTLPLLHSARASFPDFVDSILNTLSQHTEPSSPTELLPDPLSDQEQRVLRHILAGKSNQEIAKELVISAGTAKWHVHNILQKLGVKNRAQIIVRARELGIEGKE